MRERSKAYHAISEMEDTIADVERWGELLYDLGTGSDDVNRNGIFAVGRTLIALAQQLQQEWSTARIAVMESER